VNGFVRSHVGWRPTKVGSSVYDELAGWAIRSGALLPVCRTCHLFQYERLASCWYKTFEISRSVWRRLRRRVNPRGMIGGRGTTSLIAYQRYGDDLTVAPFLTTSMQAVARPVLFFGLPKTGKHLEGGTES